MPSDTGPKPPPYPLPDDDDGNRGGRALAGLGFQFAGAIVVCVLVGNWIDGRYETSPWGVLIGAATGFGAGFYSILRTVSSQTPRGKQRDRDAKGRDK